MFPLTATPWQHGSEAGENMDTKEGDTANAAGNTRQAAQEVQATAKKARTPWKPSLGKQVPNACGLWYGIATIMSTPTKP